MNSGTRVVVVEAPDDEKELIGMKGVVSRHRDEFVTVFLDGDKFPTLFFEDELDLA